MTASGTVSLVWAWLLDNGGVVMGGVAGVYAAFTTDKKGRIWKALTVAGIVAGMIWGLITTYHSIHDQNAKMEDTIARVDKYVQTQSEQSVSQIDTNTRLALAQLFGTLPNTALSASPQHVLETVKAATSANQIIHAQPEDRRNHLSIWVFDHVEQEVHYEVVSARLSQLAAQVSIHHPRQEQAATNSVWYSGDGTVSFEEARAAALIVSSAGLQIKRICPARNVQQNNLIQIGGAVGLEALPVLSISQIQTLTPATSRCQA